MLRTFQIPPVDQSLKSALERKIDQKTKPVGALGALETLALQAGLVQQTLTPKLDTPHMLVFAGDHGAAKTGVSAYPQEVTWQMVDNFLNGGAAINVFCALNAITLSVVDAGVAHDFAPHAQLVHAKIAPGTACYTEQPAMTSEQCQAALAKGAQLVTALADHTTCNVIGFGEMGIGNTASAALITHLLTATPLNDCVGRGTGLDDAGLLRKQSILQRALSRASLTPERCDPLAVLTEFGGFEIAMITGAILAAAEAGMLVLVDGFIVSVAALLAVKLHPNTLEYCIFCHHSAEPGHAHVLAALKARPMLDMGLRLGEGTGAALAYPLLKAAIAFLNDMASFESAGVSHKTPTAP